MRLVNTITSLSTLSVVSAQSASATASSTTVDAPVVTNNPTGASVYATLPHTNANSVMGTVLATSGTTGEGVQFAVSFSNLPKEGGPFLYHIHENPVPANGNCTATGAHLDPYKRGESPPCNAAEKQQCQVGDLSGKYGKPNGTEFSASYVDDYASLNPSNPAYIGNRSIVIHLANMTRIACANFASNGTAKLPPASTTQNVTLVSFSSTATGTGGPGSGASVGGSTGTATPPSPPIASESSKAAAVVGGSMSASVFLAAVIGLVL